MVLLYKSGGSALAHLFSLASAPEESLRTVQAIKQTALKHDPARQPGLHGPYEEAHLLETGRLPAAYYDAADDAPWGLLIPESRSNILWQSLSGMLDRQPDFGSAYMGLSLDRGIDGGDYARELKSLNGSFRSYLEKSAEPSHAHHRRMGSLYHSTSCPACNVLTSMACQDAGLGEIFKSITGLKSADRVAALRENGFTPLFNVLIPDAP